IAPDNKQQVEMDLSGAGGEETLSFEVITAGVYKLLVKGSGGTGQRGSYRLETVVKAAATEADRKRLKAESLMIETAALTKQGVKTTQQVIDKTEQALHLWQELGEPYWVAVCLYRIGSANLDNSQYQEATKYYDQALLTYREVKNRTGEGNTLYSLGVAYGRL